MSSYSKKNNAKIIGMMRVKNEERWIKQSILSQAPLVDRIIILDDGSTDLTPVICQSFSELVDYHRQEENVIDESRDKNFLLRLVLKHRPDWVLALDGDEVLENIAPETIKKEISLLDPVDPQFTVFYFHFLYMWNDPQYFRSEPGIYSNFWQPRLFTLKGQNSDHLCFKKTSHGSNFHCGSIPANLRVIPRKIDVKVKHYGYLNPAKREKKYKWYCQHDPDQAARGYYDHLTSEEGMVLARWQERERASSISFVKGTPYYQADRVEIAALVPENAERILDVGCGYGLLGAELKKTNPGVQVCGIEMEQTAAMAAKERLDLVVTGDVEDIKLPFNPEEFDCIILADVLEHLYDPWKILLKLHNYLSDNGLMIISIPNIRNLTIIEELLQGDWRYSEAGILDVTHLRFFTLKEMRRYLGMLGYKISNVNYIKDIKIDTLTLEEGEESFREIGRDFAWSKLDRKTVEELNTVQFIFEVKKEKRLYHANKKKLSSFIMPVYNNLNKTRLCIESILTYTPEPWELIIIDNGSNGQTFKYLNSLTSYDNIIVIKNEKNMGYPVACNQGLSRAKGEQLIFLNNDIIVADGWLGHLLDHMEDEKNVGIIGACSNYVAGLQHVKISYRCLDQYQGFSREYYWEHQGQYMLTYRLGAFCMLVKREVIDEIGGFDIRFTPGNYEDDDFCLRAAVAGFKIIVAKDVYLHHFGGSTFRRNEDEYYRVLSLNWNKFKEKWGLASALKSHDEIPYPLIIREHKNKKDYYIPYKE